MRLDCRIAQGVDLLEVEQASNSLHSLAIASEGNAFFSMQVQQGVELQGCCTPGVPQ